MTDDDVDSGTGFGWRVDFTDRYGAAAAPITLFISIHCPTPAKTIREETEEAGPFDTFFVVETTPAENTIDANRQRESRRITARAVGLGINGDQLVTHTDYTVIKAT